MTRHEAAVEVFRAVCTYTPRQRRLRRVAAGDAFCPGVSGHHGPDRFVFFFRGRIGPPRSWHDDKMISQRSRPLESPDRIGSW